MAITPWVLRERSRIVKFMIVASLQTTDEHLLLSNMMNALDLIDKVLFCHPNEFHEKLKRIKPQALLILCFDVAEGLGHDSLDFPTTVSYHPHDLLKNPKLKKMAYYDWLQLSSRGQTSES